MKRKLFILFLALASVFACAFALSACESDGTETPEPTENVSVAGKTFVFDRIEIIGGNEMKDYFDDFKTDAEESMKNDYITFKFGGKYDYVISGLVQSGTYTQSGSKVTISLKDETVDFTATENSLSKTSMDNGVSVTIVYVKGTPGKPVTPEPETPDIPTEPVSCNHKNLIEITDYKEASCKTEGYSLDVYICTNILNENGKRLICGMIFSNEEKETEPIGQLPLNYRYEYAYGELVESGQIKNYLSAYRTTYDKLPHTPVTDAAVPATCSTKGLTEGSHCKECGTVIKAQVETDYSDHDYSDTIKYSGAQGSDKVCTGCGKLENKECTFKTKLNDDGQSYTLVKAEGWVELDLGSEFRFNDKPVTAIVREAFKECNTLKSADLTGVESIGDYAFWDCTSFADVILGNNLKKIGEYAFDNCAFKSLEIPKSVEYIGTAAFYLCYKLESISIPLTNGGIQGTAAGKSEYFDYLFTAEAYAGKTGRVPESLKTVIITSGDKIGYQLFVDGCSGLKSISIPNSVTCIDMGAFRGCRGMTSITIPDSVLSIKYNAFANCTSLTSITIGNSVESIGDSAFRDCSSLTSITIPESVTKIGNYAFRDCSSLTSITIPNSVTEFGTSPFYNCPIQTAKIPAIAARYINSKSLKTVTITGGTEIVSPAFNSCTGLISLTIPDSVTTISDYAFSGCSNLTSITFNGTKEQWKAIEKGYDWNSETGEYTVHCSDGDIAKADDV